ncbi:MAG: Peptide/nickel transport system permease protein [Amycolatopsis sp.]|jgi:peptide/nickel transport system permease protein|uniref:ABC transporter permease n=1 Tax=Amycolatopsis sp. TaxID=37632 RepID=UPI0026273B71|nr:ABC transporter permease [Amycolatopsis sp.]MCU1680428.1 Peptide/nickel transport system permease protein [Amycolatopsis sp.]
MSRFVAWRLLIAVPVLLGVSIVAFLIIHLIPGNPAQAMLFGSNPTPAQLHDLEVRLGLDQPLWQQYVKYLGGLFHGDLGTSFVTGRSVFAEIAARAPSTFLLSGAALLIAIIVGVPLGILGGVRPGSIWDRVGRVISVSGVAIPYFWLALLFTLIFAVQLKVLPATGTQGFGSLIMPAVALGWGYAAILTRLVRSRLIEEYQDEYIKTARAKGCGEGRVLLNHALRNAVIPTITMLGLQIGNILTGASAIEVIFGRPGLGSFLVQSIAAKNIPVVQGAVLFIGVVYVLINLVVDVLVGVIDPRTRKKVAV